MKFGDYEATEVLGEGGMGRVYKAFQPRLNRAVCIKTLLPQFANDAQVARRFEKEASTMAALSHPNIVSVFDVGRTPDGASFIVMELVDGRPLRLVLRDESPVPVERAIKLVDQILAALAEAHLHGIIHRDLKPGNVLVVALRDGSELCKVLDFGIARTLEHEGDDPLTRTGMLLGTPGYLAPEQIAGLPYDHRIDLYAAGALLYELVTGRRVFRAANEAELKRKALFESPVPPSTVTTQPISKALDDICLKALAREPEQRYQTANAFREALVAVSRAGVSSAPSVSVFEYTPLAVAVSSSASVIQSTSARSLVSSVLAATSEWERTHLLENYERTMLEFFSTGDVESVRAAVKLLQLEQRELGKAEALKALFDLTRRLLVDSVPTLIFWLGDELKRKSATWLLRVLGPTLLPRYLSELGAVEPEAQGPLLSVIRLLDPSLSTVIGLLRAAPPKSVKAVLVAARDWPDQPCLTVFNSTLQSADPVMRQTALESLDERLAFRLMLGIRQRLHDPAVAVRAEALRWVFRLEDEDAVNDLAHLLERPGVATAERRSVWRVLSHLKTEEAVTLLMYALNGTQDVETVAELSVLLVRTRSQRAIGHVERMAASPPNAKVRRVLEEALREVRRPAASVPVPVISRPTPTPKPPAAFELEVPSDPASWASSDTPTTPTPT